MEIELGRPVNFVEVFIRAHTGKYGSFVDMKAEQVANAYKKNNEEKLAHLQPEGPDIEVVLPIEYDNAIFLQSTFTNERGHVYGIGSLKEWLSRRQAFPDSSTFTLMQKQLEDAEQRIKEQAALIKQQEEEHARIAASQEAQISEISMVQKFLKTDKRYLSFLCQETTEK